MPAATACDPADSALDAPLPIHTPAPRAAPDLPRALLHSGSLVRLPDVACASGLLPLVRVDALTVDGVPLASPVAAFSSQTFARHLFAPPPPEGQRDLFPVPRHLLTAHGDAVVRSLSVLPLDGSHRSPLRGDVYRLLHFAYALTAPACLDEHQGVRLLFGPQATPSPAALRRWWGALNCASSLTLLLEPATGLWMDLLLVTIEPALRRAWIGPPAWWAGSGPRRAWRLSGGLWRGLGHVRRGRRGPLPGSAGHVYRTVCGLEAALAWSPPGDQSPVPRYLHPVRPGGPGPDVFVSWPTLLRLSGEYLPDCGLDDPAGLRRYQRRIRDLSHAGYRLRGRRSAAAEADDTLEIVEVVRGGRSRPAGVVLRGSASFVESYRLLTVRASGAWQLVDLTGHLAGDS